MDVYGLGVGVGLCFAIVVICAGSSVVERSIAARRVTGSNPVRRNVLHFICKI